MNRQDLESGYPEQHAYDDRHRESDANAGNEHQRGEYRAGRFGRTDYGSTSEEFGQRRQDWYRNDEYHGYRDEGRSGDSRQGERPGHCSGSDGGCGFGQRNAGYDGHDQPGNSQGRYGYGVRGSKAGEYGQSENWQAGYRQPGINEEDRLRSGPAPKGYARSDERIKEDVTDRLIQANEIDPSKLDVHVESGKVKLIGSVGSRDEKSLAEQLSESVAGVKDIANQLRVQRSALVSKPDSQVGKKRSTRSANPESTPGSSTSDSRTSSSLESSG